MSGSGIQNVLEVIYANNTVGHMLSGKAVARALRGHFIVDAALNSLLAARVLGTELPCEEIEQDLSDDLLAVSCDTIESSQAPNNEVQEMSDLISNLLSATATDDDVQRNDNTFEIV